MEILQAMISRNEGHSFLEKHNLMKIVQKVAGTAEQHNLVILQQIAQNILSTHEE